MDAPTTVDEWAALREQMKQATILEPTTTQIIALRCCAVLTFLSGVLYALSFLKRRSAGMWIFRSDVEGYWHPNVHTALPIIAVLYAVFDVCAACFLERNIGNTIDPVPVLLQQLAAQTLQSFAWLKTWAVLYALPSSHHGLLANKSKSRARNIVPPWIFNAFNILIIVGIPAVQLPWMVSVYLSMKKLKTQIDQTDLLFESVVDVSTSDRYLAIYEAAFKTFLSIAGIKRETTEALRFFRTYIIINVAWTCFIAVVLFTSTSFLLNSIGAQKRFFSSALETRRALQLIEEQERNNTYSHSITSWFLESLPASPIVSDHEHSQQNYQIHRTFDPRTWRSWIHFANCEDHLSEEVSWSLGSKINKQNHPKPPPLAETHNTTNHLLTPSVLSNDVAELERNCKFFTIYWHSTLWQTILALGMISSYVILQLWLLFRMSRLHPQEIIIMTFTWINWNWGGGGLFLSIVSCIVTYSALQQSSRESDANLDQSASNLKLGALKGNITSREKLKENKAMNVINVPNVPGTRGSAQANELEVGPGPVIKISDYSHNWGISNADLSRSSSKSSATFQNLTGLLRQHSVSSTYSSMCSPQFDHVQGDKTHRNEPGPLEIEDLDTEQWDGGHFNAIHALRRGTVRDTRQTRRNY